MTVAREVWGAERERVSVVHDVWGAERERVSVVHDVWGAERERVSVARDVWGAWSTWQTDESAKQNGALHGTVITVAIPFFALFLKTIVPLHGRATER